MRWHRKRAQPLRGRRDMRGRTFVSLFHSGPYDASTNLVSFYRFEQGAKISFAKTFVSLAFDEFKKDRPDHRLGEDLQQELGAAAFDDFAVDQKSVGAQLVQRFAIRRQPAFNAVVIRSRWGRHEGEAARDENSLRFRTRFDSRRQCAGCPPPYIDANTPRFGFYCRLTR